MADFSVVMDKLQSFETAEDIAEFLKGYGIKARPGKSRYCAISEFVAIETNSPIVLTSTGMVSTYTNKLDGPAELDRRAECTNVMSEFIVKFDQGLYPDLISDPIFPTHREY